MDLLLENARKLLQTALDGPRGDEWTVYFDYEGGMHLIAGADTPLESVLLCRAARAAWRVRRRGETVMVEGLDGQGRCSLEGRAPSPALRSLSLRGDYFIERFVEGG